MVISKLMKSKHRNTKTLLFCLLIKTSIITGQIKRDMKEYNGIKFSIGLSIQFFHDEGNGKQKQVTGQNHGDQSAIFDDNKVDEFYDYQVAYLQNWIGKIHKD